MIIFWLSTIRITVRIIAILFWGDILFKKYIVFRTSEQNLSCLISMWNVSIRVVFVWIIPYPNKSTCVSREREGCKCLPPYLTVCRRWVFQACGVWGPLWAVVMDGFCRLADRWRLCTWINVSCQVQKGPRVAYDRNQPTTNHTNCLHLIHRTRLLWAFTPVELVRVWP